MNGFTNVKFASLSRSIPATLETACRLAHICVGCGGEKPYDECRCLVNKLNKNSSMRLSEQVAEDSLPLSASSVVP